MFYIVIAFRRKYNRQFKTLRGFKLDGSLIRRLIRFGLPTGVQFMIDISGFSIFLLLVGRIGAFGARADPAAFEEIGRFITILLRFVAVFTIFDTMNIVFASALKGAGDTRYVMMMIVILSIGGLTIPSIIVIALLDAGIFAAWYIVSAYIIILAISFLLRFLTGKWKTMKVIEKGEASIPVKFPAAPVSEAEV